MRPRVKPPVLTSAAAPTTRRPGVFDECGRCSYLSGKPLDSGVRYCDAFKVWRFPQEMIDCPRWNNFAEPAGTPR